ncbi:unnamed protein product [Tenebrio molitor]|nr:unnamed protein product [Tenebrio molitor]
MNEVQIRTVFKIIFLSVQSKPCSKKRHCYQDDLFWYFSDIFLEQ